MAREPSLVLANVSSTRRNRMMSCSHCFAFVVKKYQNVFMKRMNVFELMKKCSLDFSFVFLSCSNLQREIKYQIKPV